MLWHWSVDVKRFKKENPEAFRLWRLEHLINYGLEGEKLSEQELKDAWTTIKEDLDPYKARYMEFLLWGKQYSLPTNITFWNVPAQSRV